tara:strand:+ start:1646 stop:1957 length:312 start_codon:yes stop_codon:yes gene_type:complete
MKYLSYSTIEPFDVDNTVHDLSNNLNIINNQYNIINENKEIIEQKIQDISTNPGHHINYTDLEKNKKFQQMENDYKSIILQDKFLLGLGGIAFASLIVLGTQI